MTIVLIELRYLFSDFMIWLNINRSGYRSYFSSPQTKFSKQISISAVVHYKQFENFPMSLPLKLFGNQSFYLDIFV